MFSSSKHGGLVKVVRKALNEIEELPDSDVGVLVLGLPPRVEGLVGEVWRGLGQSSQLQQVDEVKILQPVGPLPVSEVRVKPLLELLNVGSPDLLGAQEGSGADLVCRVVGSEVDGNAGVQSRHGPEECSLLQAQSLQRLGSEGRTEALRFVSGDALRTEAVLLVDCPPNPSTGLAAVASEPLRVESEVDMDTVLAPARVQLAKVRLGVVVAGPGPEIIRGRLRDGGVNLVPVVFITVLVGLLGVLVVRFLSALLLPSEAGRQVGCCTIFNLILTINIHVLLVWMGLD